ncbi:ATP-binding cassette sub-family A member 5 [Colletotrichum orbiculare MAFF 240422]|uniref:ATP-binding cassette sub-family A member 5 n=1 Tax=Colletotrichum orbiculare (strain 104-T / ATCC 96160 / CBS 514.97 / LARS 414 / MAFF 240422) TaxID=1213857 RepID=A0A484FA34_COLOR|nr:ATP-binding cassette sub-family A member 5 [Colletotrichum orbiculare MAFF 240422]
MAARSALLRNIGVLSAKNYIILIARHPTSTIYTALLLPIVLTVYLGIGRNLNSPQNDYGIAEPRPIRSLRDGLGLADGSSKTVVFVDNGNTDGDISRVIASLSDEVAAAGAEAVTISDASELGFTCRPSFGGTTPCYGAVVFHSSPSEGGGWHYTLRGDLKLGYTFGVHDDANDAQVYTMPLQRAVDSAIARLNSTGDEPGLFDDVQEWAFTDETEEEREASVRRRYQRTFIDYLAVLFLLALVGISYHLPGHVATERERGLTQLVDAMMHAKHDWEPQAARTLATFCSFATIYLPGWAVSSVVARQMIWRETNAGIVLVLFGLGGFALTAQAILGAALFSRAQLSGVVGSWACILLGVLAQALPDPGTGAVAVLSFLFTPCAFVFFVKSIARFEAEGSGMDMLKAPPNGASSLPGIVIWVFLVIQLLGYPLLAAFVERRIHGVGSESRRVYRGDGPRPHNAVEINSLTRIFQPGRFRRLFSFLSKPREPTIAVNKLSLTVQRGQILALLGANGSGKSTTLDAVAGVSRFNQGTVSIDASGGIGIAPQKNVLWDELTVTEHIRIFNQLKSSGAAGSKEDLGLLVRAIGLESKKGAQSKTLSGGQKRKLQLGMMLTGGSAVCCVDEVSSGIDPISRRKIWDILLSERGKRTIIMTTHFLDEADMLADNIAILSRGKLRAEGSSVALKDSLGAGYRIHVLDAKTVKHHPPEVSGVSLATTPNTIVYTAPSSALAASVIRRLEEAGIPYRISSPNIEDVFLNVAEEMSSEDLQSGPPPEGRLSDASTRIGEKGTASGGRGSLGLQSGCQTGFVKQTGILVCKRFTLFKNNWIPFVVAFLAPIIAAAVMQLLVRGEGPSTCNPGDPSRAANSDNTVRVLENPHFAVGPAAITDGLPFGTLFGNSNLNYSSFTSKDEWEAYIKDQRRSITPGGFWIGGDGPPAMAYRADDSKAVYTAVIVQNLLTMARTNTTIRTEYLPFDNAFSGSTLDTALLAIFFTIVINLVPAFFGLYPNVERRSNVRGLQYSSGVRSLPLWTAHVVFDYGIFLVSLLVAATIFVTLSDVWYAPGYLFPVFVLFGLSSILLSYVVSLMLDSQVATFAAIMAYNTVGFGVYLIAFLYIVTFSPAAVTGRNILIGHYTISAFFPAACVFRALLVGLNTFSLACDEFDFYSHPGAMNAYGSPILYLAVQSVVLFSILLYHESGNKLPSLFNRTKSPTQERDQATADAEIADELVRVETTGAEDGLQVKHLTKKFKKLTAVDNVTFGVRPGEVFALLGPNGAGKSTTISLIRGDIQPDRRNGGAVLIEHTPVARHRALARANLGVCPQSDALDRMTAAQHLRHYARLRGVADAERQVRAVLRAVGLEAHADTAAQHLSGGGRRKLSLGIALTGDPSVVLLDEPSSGLDAAARRVVWRTLAAVGSGRAILLTTHSMEEADALATRAGFIARRMLAVGGVEELRARFGDSLHVHLVGRSAPHSTAEEMGRVGEWVRLVFPGAGVEAETYHGQMRFSVPAAEVLARAEQGRRGGRRGPGERVSAIGQLILLLEENKDVLGIAHYSVSPTTLNDVFLAIVGRHDVQEEGYDASRGPAAGEKKKIPWRKILLGF